MTDHQLTLDCWASSMVAEKNLKNNYVMIKSFSTKQPKIPACNFLDMSCVCKYLSGDIRWWSSMFSLEI